MMNRLMLRATVVTLCICVVTISSLQNVQSQSSQAQLNGILTYTFAGGVFSFTLPTGSEERLLESNEFSRADTGELLYVGGTVAARRGYDAHVG
jgi:hypothetical protein